MRPSIPSKFRALLHSQIPLTCGPHILTFFTQQVHLQSRFLIVVRYHTPMVYTIPPTSLHQPVPQNYANRIKQTLALTPPVLCPREPRPGGEPCTTYYDFELFCLLVRFSTGCRARSPGKSGRGTAPGSSVHYPAVPSDARRRGAAGSAGKAARTGSISRGRFFHHPRIYGRQAHMLYRINSIIGTPSSSRKRRYDTSCKYTAIRNLIPQPVDLTPIPPITLHAELLFIWTACDIPGTKHCKGDTK